MVGDAASLEPLLDVMAAAGRHDAAGCLRSLDEAESHLRAGFHKSRADIEAARVAVQEGEWAVAWRFAWAATAGLTWAFPPDISTCPPQPGAEPYGAADVCECGVTLRRDVRFCHMCGARAES